MDPFISNWVARLKHLNRLKEKHVPANLAILRSQSVDPSRSEASVSGSTTPSSIASSITSFVTGGGGGNSNRNSVNENRNRASTISDLNKQMHDAGMTSKEPKPSAADGGGHGHDGHQRPALTREQSRTVADDFTSYT